ncbi:uncharacterized protein LOC112682892 [Sipha flava]|uniref:Uncharacterized protein LOC112682892 n=1 Tax=Sipha flava TaxID=143950 RepID=A0A8B8FG08_9HEMI|nr:uncharacterized protein LOC112682892 [Sipha flava]
MRSKDHRNVHQVLIRRRLCNPHKCVSAVSVGERCVGERFSANNCCTGSRTALRVRMQINRVRKTTAQRAPDVRNCVIDSDSYPSPDERGTNEGRSRPVGDELRGNGMICVFKALLLTLLLFVFASATLQPLFRGQMSSSEYKRP